MKKIILFFIATLLIGGCRTTTRTKSTAESEITAKETAVKETESFSIDSIVVSKVNEVLSNIQSQSRESETERNTRITEIETLETFFNELVDQKTSGMSIHPPTGRTVRTTTRIQEEQNITREKELIRHEMTISRMKSDSVSMVSEFKNSLSVYQSELISLEKSLEEFEKKKQSCWICYLKLWWLWLIIILGILGLVFKSRITKFFKF